MSKAEMRNFMTLREFRAIASVIGVAALSALPAIAQQEPFKTTVPGDILDQFKAAKQIWTTNVWGYANNLFALLALIEFAWSAAVMLLEKTDLQSWTAAIVRKVMWLGAFYMLLLKGNQWIPWIIGSFTQIGSNAAGFNGNTLSPGDVFAQGLAIAGGLMDAASTSAFFTNPGSSLALACGALMILLSYTLITIHYVVTVVESYIVLSVGFLFLGFGGSRWTATYVERYLGLAISIGIKLMLLYMLISAGMNLGVSWMTEAQGIGTSAHPALTAFDVIGAAIIFMMLCWQIPKLFAAVLGGSPVLTGGDLVSTSAGLVVAGATTVGAATAAGSGLAMRGSTALGAMTAVASTASGAIGIPVPRPFGGSNDCGTVPPPSPPPPGPSSTGRPRQPDPPPFNSGSRNSPGQFASTDRANSNNSLSTKYGSDSKGSGHSIRNSSADASVRTALSGVGGEPVAGSGFESERPTSGFATSSIDMPDTSPNVAAPPRNADRNDSLTGVQSASSMADVSSVQENRTGDQEPAAQDRRKRIDGTGRYAHQGFTGAANRLTGLRNQLGGLPSDAAPHTPPPRMPIDHHE